jgi:TPR repeat protein
LFLGGFLFYDFYLEPEWTRNKIKTECETKLFPKLLKGFFGDVYDIKVSLNKEQKNLYRGNVEYTRNRKRFSRPIKVALVEKGSQIEYEYSLDYKYHNSGKYLEEDADYFFSKLQEGNEELKKYSIHSVDCVEINQTMETNPRQYRGIVYCTIRNNNRGKVTIVISVFEKNQSVQYSIDITEKNIENNINALKILAVGGDAAAQYNLGVCYYNGRGVARNYAEAAKWYRKAAEQGNATAQYNLGNCYYNGQGVARNYAEAAKWFRKAAEQGDKRAQYKLGYHYYLTGDISSAVKWFRKAAAQNHENAKQYLASKEISIYIQATEQNNPQAH